MFIENDTMMKLNALNVQNAHGHYDSRNNKSKSKSRNKYFIYLSNK